MQLPTDAKREELYSLWKHRADCETFSWNMTYDQQLVFCNRHCEKMLKTSSLSFTSSLATAGHKLCFGADIVAISDNRYTARGQIMGIPKSVTHHVQHETTQKCIRFTNSTSKILLIMLHHFEDSFILVCMEVAS